MPRNFKVPATVNQALDMARIVLTNARDLRLKIVANDNYIDEADKLQQLAHLGGVSAAYFELCDYVWAIDTLRRDLLRTKPAPPSCQAVLAELDNGTFTMSTVTREIVIALPELAAEVERLRAARQQTRDKQKTGGRYWCTDWRPLTAAEQASQVDATRDCVANASALLERLPARLARVREVAETGSAQKFRTASTWLK